MGAGMKDLGASSERRIITVLSADIVGSTDHIVACDPDDAQAFYDNCFEHVRQAVERASGTVVSYGGDGGIAAFGWPSSIEDHADRACAAAWEIQHANGDRLGPDGKPVQFRVGVHSGLVALRHIRREGRPRLDTVGATVNIAAKLQQSAPVGGVLVSANTARLCRAPLKLALHEPSSVLRAAETTVFRLEGQPDKVSKSHLAHRYPLPMVGRLAELAALRGALPRTDAPSRSIAIIGEPGIGKSRLAAAAVAEAASQDIQILTYFGDPLKHTTAFAAARGLFEDLLHLSGDVSRRDRQLALDKLALEDDDRAALEALLASADPRRRAMLTQALVNAFCALGLSRPTLLLVEDLHLIDPESRRFLWLLAEAPAGAPRFLLITARPEAAEELRQMAHEVIHLEPLPDDTMADLGRQLWPDADASGSMLDRVVERADGIPFVLEELIRSVGDDDPSAFQTIPHSVESVIHARLQRLSPSAKALAQALSLLGENVDIEFVEAMLDADAGGMGNDLAELERFAFVHPLRGRTTHMRHQIIAEACANTIPRERRKQLHRTAVRTITSRYSSLGGRYEQLAFHAESAGDDAEALNYLWGAAVEARRKSAAYSLSLIFNRALEVVARIGEAAEGKYVDFVLMGFASMVQLGEFEKMNIHLPRVMDLVRRSGQPRLVCNTLSQLGMTCWYDGRYWEGLKATEEGLAMARELRSPALIFSNQIMRTNLLHDTGQLDRAISEQRELCEMLTGELAAARLGAPGIPRAIALAFMSWFMIDTGQHVEGLEFGERSLEIAVRERDAYSEMLARHALGRHLLMLRRNDEAADCLSAARQLSERGYDSIKMHLAGHLAPALSRTGRAQEAVEIIEDGMRRGLHLRTGQLQVFTLHAGYGEALIRQGDLDRGLAHLAEALAIARRVNNPCILAEVLGLRAGLLNEFAPNDPRAENDLAEQQMLCDRYGIAAWSAGASV